MMKWPGRAPGVRLIAGLVSSLALVLAACGGGAARNSEAATDPSGPATQDGLVAVAHTQPAGDESVIDSMLLGLDRIEAEFGVDTRAVYAEDPATYQSTLQRLAQEGATVVVGTFPGMSEPLKTVAPQFPEVRFIHLYADAAEDPIPNLRTVGYNYHHGMYLAGMLAGSVTSSDRLGFVGGASQPTINADYNAFTAGANSVNDSTEVGVAFTDSFSDPALGRQVASQLYQDGIDVIQTDSAGADAGIIASASEQQERAVVGGNPGQCETGPETVMAVVMASYEESIHENVSDALQAEWEAGHVMTGLGPVIDLVFCEPFAEQGPEQIVRLIEEVEPEIAEAREAIIAGELDVPFDTEL